MSVSLAPKYEVGTTFYIATTDTERRDLPCPDCLGEKEFKVIAPSGDEFTMTCPRCGDDVSLRDVPPLSYNLHTPKVHSDVIAGYCVNEWGKEGIKYRGQRGYSVKEADLITDEEVARKQAELLAAAANAKADAEPKRIHHKALGAMRLKEAVHDQFNSGLYDAWSAFRFLRETVDEIIENEQHDYSTRDEIVQALEDKLQQTQRYEFIFKGFTRAMETVVALVNAGEDDERPILTALRDQWKGLPDDIQEAWQPNERIATDWEGKPCPTY